MSTHEGVSCDGCVMPNFSGNRYKCLRCYDFDLCHTCYTTDHFQEQGEHNHVKEHPMQLIMSGLDFEIVYAGDETKNYETCKIGVCTCPYCGEHGFSFPQFYDHVVKSHPEPPFDGVVNCPLCIGSTEFDSNREVENLKEHWQTMHFNLDPNEQQVNGIYNAGGTNRNNTFESNRVLLRSGARRPMLARRTGRPLGGAAAAADRVRDRDLQAQAGANMAATAVAAAHFGMPWTNDFDDLSDMFRAMNRVATGIPPPAGNPVGEGGRFAFNNRQRLHRNLTNSVDASEATLQRLLQTLDRPSFAHVVRGGGGEGSGEYAAPRRPTSSATHAQRVIAAASAAAAASSSVLTIYGTRPVLNPIVNHTDSLGEALLGGLEEDESSLATTLTGSNTVEGSLLDGVPGQDLPEDEEEDVDIDDDANFVSAEDLPRLILDAISQPAPQEEPAVQMNREPVLDVSLSVEAENSSEVDQLADIDKNEAIAASTMTESEYIDLRKREDPFAGRLLDPWKALRANTTDQEWAAIRKLLRDVQEDSHHDSMEDLCTETAAARVVSAAPVGAAPNSRQKEEEEDTSVWMTIVLNSEGRGAPESYWSDKRYIRPRKLERAQSLAQVDEKDRLRKMDIAVEILHSVAGEKVPQFSSDQSLRATLDNFDFTRVEEMSSSDAETRREYHDMLAHQSEVFDEDYDKAVRAIIKEEVIAAEKILKEKTRGFDDHGSTPQTPEQLTSWVRRLHRAQRALNNTTRTSTPSLWSVAADLGPRPPPPGPEEDW